MHHWSSSRNHSLGRDSTFATRGGLQPCRESLPFPDDAQARLDISFIHANQSHLLDFAVTSHLRRYHLTAAAETPGGAATSYEVVKRNRYLSHVRPGQVLHPVVFDTLGAWGASAVHHRIRIRASQWSWPIRGPPPLRTSQFHTYEGGGEASPLHQHGRFCGSCWLRGKPVSFTPLTTLSVSSF